jgi:spore maturation protein SpmA/spore maturation protein SpmB
MALSRIWAAFILISITVAAIKYSFTPGYKGIFSEMVVGKAGDTIRVPSDHLRPAESGARPTPASAPASTAAAPAAASTVAAPVATPPVYHVQQADGILETCKTAVNLSINLIGIMALFMGFINIAERAGGVNLLARIVGPFFSKLFPEVPKGHPAMGHMVMNFSANLLGLDNAATPFALKAMESLQEFNPDKDKASNTQIMFLCLHASGLQLIPISIIAVRAATKAPDPTDVFIPIVIATFIATLAAMIIVSIKQRINLFQPVILLWVGGFSALIALVVLYLQSLDAAGIQAFSGVLANGLILLVFLLIVLGALYKKINIFEAFAEGAKGGFDTAVRIIPYLVGMLVAISLLRNSGAFDMVLGSLSHLFSALGTDTRFVEGLPTALIKPLSGAGARGMMVDTMTTYGPNSFAGRLSCILQGSSDTTFYIVAVYFGAVSIKNTRYAIGAMLLADLVGIIASIFLCYLFFGHSV